MIVHSLAEALALSEEPLPVPDPAPEADLVTAQRVESRFVLRWFWDDGRLLSLCAVDPSVVRDGTWRPVDSGGRRVSVEDHAEGRGARAYTVVDGTVVVASGSLGAPDLVAALATVRLRRRP